ncbi:MAG: hypothetical protein M1812_006374 [Candelaria pacifica]|nr:MAG: hypothetical protein M1812_006374 [Candelaria pacifica]
MSSAAMQAAPPQTQAAAPLASHAPSSAQRSGRQYHQQSREPYISLQSAGTPKSHSPGRRPGRRSGGNGASVDAPNTPQPAQYYSPNVSNTSNVTTPRNQPLPPSTHASPNTPTIAASPPYNTHRTNYSESGPPIPPPPRTSSHQQTQSTVTAPASLPVSDRVTSTSRRPHRAADRSSPSRATNAGDGRERGDRERAAVTGQGSGSERERAKDDAAIAAALAVRSRRKAQQSPQETPQRSSSTRESRARQSPAGVQSQSVAAKSMATPPGGTGIPREGSTVINRVVVTDPQIDVGREKERLAEARPAPTGTDVTPVTGLGLVGSEGVDDGGRGGGKSRQDYSSTSSASQSKQMKFGEYILGQTLGEGEFGKVKMGWKKDGGVQVAIKLIRRETLGSNPSRLPKIYREISILRELSHPNIVRLHEMVETDRQIGIILEYASGGELFDYILNHRYLKDNAARRLFAQLVSGVGYLHKKGIVHRDLKLENLLLDRNRNIIITDFGFANTFDPVDELGDEIEYNLTNKDFVRKMDLDRVRKSGFRRGDLMQTSCGSPCYAAPELVVSDSLYTGRKVDVWSCGVILYAMLAGYLPFDDDPANPEGDNINLLYKYIVSTPLTFPEWVSPHARDMLKRILVPDPRKRADLFEVARHSWLSEYAHVVSFITSSTTTTGDIANTTVTAGMSSPTQSYLASLLVENTNTESRSISPKARLTGDTDDHQDAPLLARSASVREPTKTHSPHIAAVGGLTQKHGPVDQEQQADKPKTQRDAKRRTVQVEYVAPQSQTVRGEPTPPITSPATVAAASNPTTAVPGSRARSGSQGPVPVSRQAPQTATSRKTLPQESLVTQETKPGYPSPVTQSRSQQRTSAAQQSMPPPSRPGREVPRSASDSTGAFGQQVNAPSMPRPTTGNSLTSMGGSKTDAMRLPSRGNSYGQPLAPTVAATNAQGRLAQPKNGNAYNISAPIPQQDPYDLNPSMGRPSTQQLPAKFSQGPHPAAHEEQGRGHKRSNTEGGMGGKFFGRSGSLFGGRSQNQSPQEPPQKKEKSYPPVSMQTQPAGMQVAADTPRQSMESRRSTSFGFGRKSSDLGGREKPRRFSLLPASFSLKSFGGGGGSRDHTPPTTAQPSTEQRDYAPAPRSRGNTRPQMAFGRGQSFTSSSTEDSGPAAYDGQQGRNRYTSAPQPRPGNPPVAAAPQQQDYRSHYKTNQPGNYGGATEQYTQLESTYRREPTNFVSDSETSLNVAQQPPRPQYPAGFNSYDEYPPSQQQQGRRGKGPGVLQKNNRKFADAYDREQEPGYGAGGQHSGSSGAARKVMDFFRRRGKARTGDDR